jgi:hypothetical protein
VLEKLLTQVTFHLCYEIITLISFVHLVKKKKSKTSGNGRMICILRLGREFGLMVRAADWHAGDPGSIPGSALSLLRRIYCAI